jgi:hypothetical protein
LADLEYQSEKDVPTKSSRKKKRMSMTRRRVILDDRDMAMMERRKNGAVP